MTTLDYTMEQPEIFQKVLEQNVEIMAGSEEIFDGEKSDHVYLIVSGVSCDTAKAVTPFMEYVLKREASVFSPSQMERVFREGPLLIFISQGGKSTNMIAAVEKMKEYPRIAMTGSTDGRINPMCGHHIMIPCRDKAVGPKTKGCTTAILTLYLVALEAARKTDSVTEEEYREYLAVLETSLVQYQENIERARKWMKKNEGGLQALKEIYPIGKGQSMFIVQEGVLKMMETYLIPGLSYDFEEYLREPSCLIREIMGGIYLFLIVDDGDYERVQELAVCHRSIRGQMYVVDLPASEGERDCTLLNSGRRYMRPFEEILPLQMTCVVIPKRLGIDGAGMQYSKEIDKFMDVKYREDVK